jgi:hypothetical protein
MASKREKAAAKAGMSLKEYKKSSAYKKDKKKDSGDEKKAKKQSDKYYDEKKGFSQEQNALDLKKLQQDLDSIYQEAGIAKTRAMEDYNRNIGNIESNKALDISTVADYVTTNKGRTQEDLNTSLAKETRRYALEYDQINQDLADRGMTFSERTPEKIAQESSNLAKGDIETAANRSFQDIARYEAAQTRELELKYGQQVANEEYSKNRTLEDVTNELNKEMQKTALSREAQALGFKENLSDIGYQKADSSSSISNYYDSQANQLKNITEQNAFGV